VGQAWFILRWGEPRVIDLASLLFELVDDGWGFTGAKADTGPTPAELLRLLAREARTRRLSQLTGLERERRAGRLDLPEFRRRYSRLARREPADDPARQARYGPNSAELERFVARVRSMGPADWSAAEEHLRNLQANPMVRKSLLDRYRSVLEVAIASARLSAAAAVADAIGECVPRERRAAWGLALTWLPMVLVTIEGAIAVDAAFPLGRPGWKAIPDGG
jgi:hypothetical protein